MATTKIKKYAKGGPGDKVTGSEQGKSANLARKLGTIIPSIGAAAVAIKAGMDKRKEKREIKKGIKIEVDKKAINIKDSNNSINYPKSGTTTTGSGSVSKAKYGTSVGATKMKKYAMGGSALRPATDKANRGMYQMGGRMNNNPKPMPERKPRQITMDEKYGILGDYGPKTEADTNMSNYIKNVGIAPIPGRRKGGATKMYKTGGMVNANAKIAAAKKATGRVGGITKAISKGAIKSTSPKGKVGGTSTAPKCASPKKTK
jgi:hypothetical protein